MPADGAVGSACCNCDMTSFVGSTCTDSNIPGVENQSFLKIRILFFFVFFLFSFYGFLWFLFFRFKSRKPKMPKRTRLYTDEGSVV